MTPSLTTLEGLVDAVASWASRTGAFGPVAAEEPTSGPTGNGITAGIWEHHQRPARSSGLAAVSFRVTLMLRALIGVKVVDRDRIMRRSTDAFMVALLGDLSLGGIVRQVDVFGQEGQALEVARGYVGSGETTYRSTTITIPVIVNDLYSEAFQ